MAERVVITGGGTGGHLYPGIALAKELQKSAMKVDITFIGTRRGIESKVLPQEGFPLKTVLSGGLVGKKGLGRLLSWLKLPVGFIQAFLLLLLNRPALVVGVGGYVSGPVVLAAWLLRIPILIHEQNSIAGATNKWLGRIADKVAVSFDETRRFFPQAKVVFTGNMIREEFCLPAQAQEPESEGKFVLTVLGGSQGAHSINVGMMDALQHLAEKRPILHLIHQTGEKDFAQVQQHYADQGFSAEVKPFFHDMVRQVRRASLILCRAGATTIAEITACGKAAILVPFPHAAHNHQEKNARVLESAGAGTLVLDKDLSGERLAAAILNAMREPDGLREMEKNSHRLGNREATQNVGRLCLELLKRNRASGATGKSQGNYALSCI